MPQITLIGVTGPSGKPLIEKVLALQYTIVIYARNPQKLDDALKADSRVRIVKGSSRVLFILITHNLDF